MTEATRFGLRLPAALVEAWWPALFLAADASVRLTGDGQVARVIDLVLVFSAVLMVPVVVRACRRRGLTCWSGGLVVQLDGERVTVDWDDLVAVARCRHRLLLPVDELVFRAGHVDPIGSRGQDSRSASSGECGETRVLVSLFDSDWRTGPVCRRARAAGLAL